MIFYLENIMRYIEYDLFDEAWRKKIEYSFPVNQCCLFLLLKTDRQSKNA